MTKLRPYIIGAIGGVLALGLLPVTGLLDIAAEPERSDITDLYFRLASRQSIALRSFGMGVPPLDDPAMVARAAGHYELVCAACHGSPAGPPERFAHDMSPQPPPLMEQMQRWRPDARLFWTVRHGIRRSAMPAWPSQVRDDEVWDMVAFLGDMAELDEDAYRTMAGTADCTDCHGEAGQGGVRGQPRLDIQTPEYLAAALRAFRNGTRESGTMKAAAARLDDTTITELASQFGESITVRVQGGDRGAEIAQRGIPKADVAACDSCHQDSGNTLYPRLAGQDTGYLIRQLKLFAELGAERGGPKAHIMAHAIGTLSEDDMHAVADWYGE